ncbi:MAG: MFS transporter, partial [Solirubrobacteraceae bacterium]
MLRGIYADPGARARALGAWGGIAGVGAASGPLLGGLLAGTVGWRAVFVVNVPVGLATLALYARHGPRVAGVAARGLDPAGQALWLAGFGALVLGLIEAGERGWTSPVVLGV